MKKMLLNNFIMITLVFCTQNVVFADAFQDGIDAFNQQNYVLAEKCFKESLVSSPDNYNIRYYLAITLVQNKKYKEARQEYSTIILNAPNSEAANNSRKGLSFLSNLIRNMEPSKVVLDINNNHKALIVNNVKVNNKEIANFILDSGASYTAISPLLASKLNLPIAIAPRVKVATANGTVMAPKVLVNSIEVNGLTAKNLEVLVLNIDTSKSVQGLLGLNFMQKFKVTIDKQNGKIILEK